MIGRLPFRRRKVELPPQVRVLAVVGFLVAGGFGIIGPAIPLLATEFGAGAAVAGLAISLFAAFRVVSGFLAGPLVDRWGERPVLVTGLMMQSTTSIAAGFAPDFATFLALRAVGGLGSAAFTVAGMSLLLRITPADRRGRALAVYHGGFVLGGISGPAVGGFLAEASARLPLIVYGICLLIASVIGMLRLVVPPLLAESAPEPAAEPGAAGEPGRFAGYLTSPVFLVALGVSFATGWTMYGVRNSLIPLYVVDGLQRTAGWAGAALFAAALAQAVFLLRSGDVVDSSGPRRVVRAGLLAGTVSMAVIAVFPNVVALGAGLLLLGLAGALLSTSSAALLGSFTGGRRDGKAVAGFSIASDAGAITSPVVCGLLVDSVSFEAAFLLCAVVFAVVLGLSALLRRSPA